MSFCSINIKRNSPSNTGGELIKNGVNEPYNGISIELGRNAERPFGTVQNIIVSYKGVPITSQDKVAGLGEMNIVINDGEIIVGMIRIPEAYQNKGLAKHIYQAVADRLRLPIINSKLKGYNQSESGSYIWKNRTVFTPKNQDNNSITVYNKQNKVSELYPKTHGERLKPTIVKMIFFVSTA